MRARVLVLCALLVCAACGGDDTPRVPRVRAAAPDTTPAEPPVGTMSIDTTHDVVLDIWALATTPQRQVEVTRRIVESLHAELNFLPGFDGAALLGSGDGTALLLVAAWQDSTAADSGTVRLARLLQADADTAAMRKRLGTATARVALRHTAGTPPLFSEGAMLQVTRYAVKPGHSFGALAALADSNLVLRVVQDTAAAGGATLAAADSGALYMLIQARNATALDATVTSAGPLPFWAPFATRDEQLMAVVASIHRR